MSSPDESIRDRLARYQPLFGLEVRTPRVRLRLPTDPELVALLDVIEGGVHDPSWMPFQIPWTDTPQPQRDRDSLAHWWGIRASWTPASWRWGAAVRVGDAVVGIQVIGATEFAALREVATGSWLGRRHQGQGIGSEMRAAILHLAFEGLGAERAHSGYLDGNEASRRVSEKLGYEPNGFQYRLIRGQPRREVKLVLERTQWLQHRRSDIEIVGLEQCRDQFGL